MFTAATVAYKQHCRKLAVFKSKSKCYGTSWAYTLEFFLKIYYYIKKCKLSALLTLTQIYCKLSALLTLTQIYCKLSVLLQSLKYIVN